MTKKSKGGKRPKGGSQRNLENYLAATKQADRFREQWAANKAAQDAAKKEN